MFICSQVGSGYEIKVRHPNQGESALTSPFFVLLVVVVKKEDRLGIEPAMAAPSHLDCLGVSRSNHLTGSKNRLWGELLGHARFGSQGVGKRKK